MILLTSKYIACKALRSCSAYTIHDEVGCFIFAIRTDAKEFSATTNKLPRAEYVKHAGKSAPHMHHASKRKNEEESHTHEHM